MKTIKLSETDRYRVEGRTVAQRDPLTLLWTGSSLDLYVRCSELWVEMEGPYSVMENWVAFEVNGAVIARQMVARERNWVCIFRGKQQDPPSEVRIIKEVQAMSGDPLHCLKIHALRLDGELLPVPGKQKRIEFIGDSITSAEGTAGAQKEEEWISMYFSHVHSYPYLTAKALDAEYRVISQSGWGVCMSWDNQEKCTIPRYYEQICGLVPGGFAEAGFHEKYDFSVWQPDVICVNLGTNDDGAFHNPPFTDPLTGKTCKLRMDGDRYMEEDRRKVQEAIRQFLAMLRKNNPGAYILWAYGILGDPMKATICAAIEEHGRTTGDKAVEYLALPQTTEETFGSRWHPGMRAHQAAAEAILGRIRELL